MSNDYLRRRLASEGIVPLCVCVRRAAYITYRMHATIAPLVSAAKVMRCIQCSLVGCCHTGWTAEFSTRWVHRKRNSAIQLISALLATGHNQQMQSVDADYSSLMQLSKALYSYIKHVQRKNVQPITQFWQGYTARRWSSWIFSRQRTHSLACGTGTTNNENTQLLLSHKFGAWLNNNVDQFTMHLHSSRKSTECVWLWKAHSSVLWCCCCCCWLDDMKGIRPVKLLPQLQRVSAKLHYTDTGYRHVVQHHERTSQCHSPTSRYVKMLWCGKFLSVGGEFVVQQVVEMLWARLFVRGVVQHVRSQCPCSGVWHLTLGDWPNLE